MLYRTPFAYISDIEVMTGKSYMTSRRIMAEIKRRLGLSARQKPTLEQVKQFLVSQ